MVEFMPRPDLNRSKRTHLSPKWVRLIHVLFIAGAKEHHHVNIKIITGLRQKKMQCPFWACSAIEDHLQSAILSN
jgi:hypothetical protein